MLAIRYLCPKRLNQLLISIVAVLLTILGCAESDDGRDKPGKAKTSLFTGKKITFMTNLSLERGAKMLAKWFHEESGAIVELKIIHYSKLAESILADNTADSPQADIYMSWYVDLGKLVEEGALADITDFIEKNKELIQPEDFFHSIYDTFTRYRQRRWALPFDGDIHVILYRKSLLAKYNLPPPDTWEEFLNAARTITENERENGIYGCAIMAHPAPILIISCFMNRLGSYGGTLLDADGRPAINSIEAQLALQDMLNQSAFALPTPTETDFAVARDAFLNGQVAMTEQWADIGDMAENPKQSLVKGDWGVTQIPRGKGPNARHASALNAGFNLCLSSKAPQPEIAKAFLLFASRPDIMLKLNKGLTGVNPVRRSVFESKEYKPFSPELKKTEFETLQAAKSWPTIPQMDLLIKILADNISAALEKRITTQKALEDTQREWMKIIP